MSTEKHLEIAALEITQFKFKSAFVGKMDEIPLVFVGFLQLKISVLCFVFYVCLLFHFVRHYLVCLPTLQFLSAPLVSLKQAGPT